jgi:SAM-dependent methyltransferase
MQPPSPDPEMLRRIPLSARSILHVGCGTGGLLAGYRLMNPTARQLGIDTNADTSGRCVDEIVAIDVEAEPLPFEVVGGIDCIIYDSILERVRDPWALLQRHSSALSPDGMMLIRLPNMDCGSLTDRQLPDDPEVGQSAPRDELHRFTLEGTRRALLGAGLVLCDVMRYETTDFGAGEPGPTLASVVWRVRKQQRPRMQISGNMLAPVGGVSHVRVLHPLQAVGTDPAVSVRLTDKIRAASPSDSTASIYILHRPVLTGSSGAELLRSLIAAGYLVVTEFDDHPDFFRMMQFGGEMSFRGVHAIQTSTPALAEVLREYNPEIAVFPNAVASLPAPCNFADPHRITCFFGALNREPDWQPLMPAINAVAAEVGARLNFQVVHDQRFFQALASPHKTFTPTCDYDTYLRLLSHCEISLMPLSDTPFNRAKSDLKFIEAGSRRVAPVASSVVYGDSVEHNHTGLLFRDARELRDQLLRLVQEPEWACNLGNAAWEYVRHERMMAYQVAPRIAWYRSLWDRRTMLAAAREARIG